MNKGGKIILLVLLIILVIGLSISLALFIKNDYSFDFFNKKLELIDSKEFDSINNLNINTDTADVYIKTSENNMVKVELYSNDAKENEIENTANSLNVILKQECHFFCFANKSKINVYLPASYSNDINIVSTTGDIFADDYASSNLNLVLTTGDVFLKNVKNAEINVTTGDIKINSVNDVKIITTTGDIVLGKVNNYLDLETTTGDIDIDEANLSKNSTINATTGDINIKKINDVYVDAKTTTGDTDVENNNRKSDIELSIKTTTGDVRVN